MAEISKIKLDENIYTVKDSEARESIETLQTALENYITTTAALVGGNA